MDFWGFLVFTMVARVVVAIAHPNSPHKRFKKHPLSKLCRCKWVRMMSVQSFRVTWAPELGWPHLTYELSLPLPPSCNLHPNLGRKFQHFRHNAHIFLNVPSEVGSHWKVLGSKIDKGRDYLIGFGGLLCALFWVLF
jgi:hypothetical protein